MNTDDDGPVLAVHRRAMVLIDEIEQIISGLGLTPSRQAAYQRSIIRWTQWVIAWPHHWHGNPAAQYKTVNDGDALDMLDLLAQHLEGIVPTINEPERLIYTEIINELIAAIAEDDSLPTDMRQHLYTLISHARHCLEDYEIMGDFALKAAVDRLAAAAAQAANKSSNPSVWAGFRDKLFWPLTVNVLAAAPTTYLAIDAATRTAGG